MQTKYLSFCRSAPVSLSANIPTPQPPTPIRLGWEDIDGLKIYIELTPSTITLVHAHIECKKVIPSPDQITTICQHDNDISEEDVTNFRLFMQHGVVEEINDFKAYCALSQNNKAKGKEHITAVLWKEKEKKKEQVDEDTGEPINDKNSKNVENNDIEISDEEMRQIHNWKSWVRRETSINLANNLGNTVYEEHIKISPSSPLSAAHHLKLVVKDRVVKVYLCCGEHKEKLSPILTFDKLGYAPTAPKMHNPLSIAKIINQGVVDIKVKY